MDINFDDVEKLLKIAENSNIGELEITSGHQSIRITCQAPQGAMNQSFTSQNFGNRQATQSPSPRQMPTQSSASTANSSNPADTQPTSQNSVSTPSNAGTTITSPMVGTFYRKSSPEMPAFVEVNSTVSANQTLGIIEAMKIMHEIKAEKAGKITAILAEDGAMVEYGVPLFTIAD